MSEEETRRSQELRAQLVAHLRRCGVLRSARVAAAFATLPREAFVSHCYVRTGDGRGWQSWQAEACGPERWLELVYTDQVLVTRLDGDWPSSSSSMPSYMARMLEALEVQPGQQVLEIGTGTGYTAALLAWLTGEPRRVVTVEVVPELAVQAREALLRTVGPVRVIRADGWLGYAPAAPYERLLVTASAASLSLAWLRQLAPGGRLVLPLQGGLQEGRLLVLERAEAAEAEPGRLQGRGHCLPEPCAFMPLTGERFCLQVLNELSRQPARQWHEPATGLVPQALQEPAGRWWLQWATGAFGTVGRTRAGQWMVNCLQPQQQALVHLEEETASSWRVRAQGREAAQWWQQLEAAAAQWQALGCPPPEALELCWEGTACWWQVGTTRLPLVVRPVEASRSCEAQASGIS
ncbi:rRNA adenine N-6-methyltransferase family protein [Thermogemmatispora tikiterensis]|uniref:rRNA adenine N-6-methyltransferase family protein n=1 Tax=Thermogemmatispora tikiterensis TaxID=1825093 RepID=UPI0016790A18|nr:rRNA adenine N-6-methyltransferase family protein [Thermogemmatispora tikiterensis]